MPPKDQRAINSRFARRDAACVDQAKAYTRAEALALLDGEGDIHSITLGVAVSGAHLDRRKVEKLLASESVAYGVLPGTIAADLDHCLAIWTHDRDGDGEAGRWLYMETAPNTARDNT
ncbi:hypothetical protein NB700_001800 [Xanthomonas sacchari]|uniref:Uncharacterized protein n=2 Tax=Xanthomonas TaxID=338 RepID=A0ABT3DWD0_9XANT|nr:hypothetical protein [Xanthomonas sacchari]